MNKNTLDLDRIQVEEWSFGLGDDAYPLGAPIIGISTKIAPTATSAPIASSLTRSSFALPVPSAGGSISSSLFGPRVPLPSSSTSSPSGFPNQSPSTGPDGIPDPGPTPLPKGPGGGGGGGGGASDSSDGGYQTDSAPAPADATPQAAQPSAEDYYPDTTDYYKAPADDTHAATDSGVTADAARSASSSTVPSAKGRPAAQKATGNWKWVAGGVALLGGLAFAAHKGARRARR